MERRDRKVSIVMPAYNCERTLDSAIKSVIEQTWELWELLIIVDAATDSTLERSLYWQTLDNRIRVISNESNIGVANTRNKGLSQATGRYVAFLDSDDQWFHNKLEQQISFMESSKVDICYTSYRRLNSVGRILSEVRSPAVLTYKNMLSTNSIGNSTAVYDRSRLEYIRFKDVGHEDYVFWLEAIKQIGRAYRIPDPSPKADYLVGKGSLSSNKIKAAIWQWGIYRKYLFLPVWSASWYFFLYIFYAVKKRM